MKNLIFLLLLIVPFLTQAQTDKIEKQTIQSMFESKEIKFEKYKIIAKDWNAFIAKTPYPDLHFIENENRFDFTNIIKLDGVMKKDIYNRILEWVALSYGSLAKVLHYKDEESGKILVKGWFPVTYRKDSYNFWGTLKENDQLSSSRCYHTVMYTIKDNKCKIEIFDIDYQFEYQYSLTTGGYSTSTYKTNLNILFPIILRDKVEWKGTLNLVIETDSHIKQDTKKLQTYIMNIDIDYNF